MSIVSALTYLSIAILTQQSFAGVLEDTDPVLDDTRRYDSYTITLEEMQQVSVRMTSEDFDTYLIVRSPSGREYSNDDYEGISVSLVEFVAPEAGEWHVLASSFSLDMGGAYTVEITLGGIAEVETISGRLDPSDDEAIKGEYYDTHTLEIAGDAPFALELVSYGFDGYLVARSPSGETFRNDDGLSGSGSSHIGDLTGAGTWTVYVTSSCAGEMGAYDLNIVRTP